MITNFCLVRKKREHSEFRFLLHVTLHPSITHNILNHLMNQSVHQEEIQHNPHQQLNVIRSFPSRKTHLCPVSSVHPLTLNSAHHYRLCPCYTTCFQSRLRSLYYPCLYAPWCVLRIHEESFSVRHLQLVWSRHAQLLYTPVILLDKNLTTL